MTERTRVVESTYDPSRREWNLLIRRPFYLNLRLGGTQNALWIGRRFRAVFNRFPWRNAKGGWGPARRVA